MQTFMGSKRGDMRQVHKGLTQKRKQLNKLNPSDKNYQKQVHTLAHDISTLVEQNIILQSAMRAAMYRILTKEQRQKAKQLRQKQPHMHPHGEM